MRYYIEHLPMTIPMGVQSENNAEAVEFDVSDWLARDGSLSFSVWVTRPGETEAYQAANATLKDGVLYWWPTGADTAIAGEGRVEILAVSANRRMLSGWTATSIRETTTETTTDAPVDQRPWLDQALLASAEAKAAATSAAASAEQAEGVVKKEIATLTEDIARNTAPPIVPTATGSIVNIMDGAARPAVELISHIEPVETGSGEKGPDNPWTISGWNSVTAQSTGANLLNYDAWKDKPVNNGTAVWANNGVTITAGANGDAYTEAGYTRIDCAPGVKYVLSWAHSGGEGVVYIFPKGSTDGMVSILSGAGHLEYTPTEGVDFFTFRVGVANAGSTAVYTDVRVNIGSDRGFTPYQGKTLTADLPETVYGGKKNWTTGALTVGMYKKSASDFQTIVCGVNADGVRYADLLHNGVHRSKQYGDCVSNVYKPLPSGTTYSGAIRLFTNEITVYDERFTNEDVARALLEEMGFEVVYELDEPYTIQLTPQQLDTLHGINNVWSDCGDTTISYVADTKSYIDQKLAAIAAATL